MGCDIHTRVERLRGASGIWEPVEIEPIFEDSRTYALFGWLADVRNYSAVPPLAAAKPGLPTDVTAEVRADLGGWGDDGHSCHHVYAHDLVGFRYQDMMEDRRYTKKTAWGSDGGATCEPGQGEKKTWAVFLGPWVLAEILRLAAVGDPARVRLIFWFDN